jgi:hypothetical protein
MDNPREGPRRDKIEWNSRDCCLELDNKRFKEHSVLGEIIYIQIIWIRSCKIDDIHNKFIPQRTRVQTSYEV